VQRLGPATGGATTVGQGDVQFVRWGTSGGYPVIALAPSTVPECLSLTMRAFDLAERFRCPVFLLTDKELNLTRVTVEVEHYAQARGRDRLGPPVRAAGDDRPYRYDPPDGVPPMRHYGDGGVVRFTGSTHDERAFITKDPATVGALNRHLQAKIHDHRDEIELVDADLEDGASTLLTSFGVTAGAMREAAAAARADGQAVSTLTLQSLWPVPERALARALAGVRRVVVAELNQGQYRREIERLVGDSVEVCGLNRTDGELIEPGAFLEMIR
jgi:2-oxoglutarate ferredoxin oxidoreductase subunit alpha